MPEILSMLRQAVQAARAGERDLALDLFLEIVDQDPYCTRAWVELSKLVEDPEDCATALENALALRPGNANLQARLEALRENHPFLKPAHLSEEQALANERLYELGSAHLTAGRTIQAAGVFQQVVRANPGDMRAWLMLGDLLPDPQERVRALERVVVAQPLNEQAWRRLENLRSLQHDPLQRGKTLEARGDVDQAVQIYNAVIAHSPQPRERREAALRIEQIRLRQEAGRLQPIDPNLNLARLAGGPVLLFGVMVFIQSGMNPLHLPIAVLPGLLSVLIGGLLVAVTGMQPVHPRWVALVGRPGAGDEPEIQRGLRLLGLALMLAPYTLFLIEAGRRLGMLHSALLGP